MGKKDIQLLKELDKNSRQSNTQISKKIGIKKETANYTIKKLEKEGIIKGYFSLINYFKLGSKIFKLLIRYQNVGEGGESRIVKWLTTKQEVVWVGKTEGKWDLIVTIRQTELRKIYRFLEEFNKTFSKNIGEKQLLMSYEFRWLNEKYLYGNNKEDYKTILNQKDKKEKIDNIDKKIIDQLEHNARTPLIKIASNVKLTAEATAKRIKNLIKKGIVARFKLRINLEKLGKGYHHLFISLKDFSKIEKIISYYENSKKCVFIMKYHGVYDLHIELISDSQNDFRKIITEFRENFGNLVSDYQQLTILEDFKLS